MLNRLLADYFGFNREQRQGLVVLLCISFILFLIRITYPHFIAPDKIVIKSLPLYERKSDSLSEEKEIFSKKGKKVIVRNKLFAFNLNTVNKEQLISLGFKEKSAKALIKYRTKAGKFKRKTDLKKIFGVTDSFYDRLEPYILLSDEKAVEKFTEEKITVQETKKEVILIKPKKEEIIVELNTADSSALIGLDGIGTSFARRIIKYRELLGGFINKEQVKEVFGFTDELYAKIEKSVRVEKMEIRKINLNKDSFKTINKHPYISYELTKSIFDWRRKTTINVTTLKSIINDDKLHEKLMPYLDLEP